MHRMGRDQDFMGGDPTWSLDRALGVGHWLSDLRRSPRVHVGHQSHTGCRKINGGPFYYKVHLGA